MAFFRSLHAPLVSATDFLKSDHVIVNISWLQFVAQLSQMTQNWQLQVKSYKGNYLDFASAELFSVTHLELYLARNLETLQNTCLKKAPSLRKDLLISRT